MSEAKDRERRLIECRKTAEERKNYFESMERHMFATRSSVKETGRESISTSDHQASSAGRTDSIGGEETEIREDLYEEAFARMKKAAGVSDVDEVVRRFETQEETTKHLLELQNRAEREIRDLGAVKEKLEAEWELVKFMGQEENTELREKMEDLEDKIGIEQDRKKEAEESLKARNKLLVGIREGLDHMVRTLFVNETTGVPTTRNSLELLHISTDKLSKLMTRLSGINLFMKKMEMEEEGFIPIGLDATAFNARDFDDEKESKYSYTLVTKYQFCSTVASLFSSKNIFQSVC